MTAVYKSGQDLNFNVALEDESGGQLIATAVAYAVFDDEGNELITRTTLDAYEGGATTAQVTVPAEFNVTEDTAAGRRLELYVTTDAGEYEIPVSYIIRRFRALKLLDNSFMTIEKAKAVRVTFAGDFTPWDGASEDAKVAALETAYRRLLRLRYRYRMYDGQDVVLDGDVDYSDSMGRGDVYRHIRDMSKVTKDQWDNQFPARFRGAITRAQFVEANHILSLDVAEMLRAKGVVAETVGESQTIFRKSLPLDLQVCVEAFRELSGYVDATVRFGRG